MTKPGTIPDPRLICVVVNWNGWQDTLACLDSLALQDYSNLAVIVVDNGSTNDSAVRIRQAHPFVLLQETGRNRGFSAGCNIGARIACAQGAALIWLLNNDTVAPPDTASKLVSAALANPEAAVIGAVLYYLDDPGKIQAWGGGSISRWTGYNRHYTTPTPLGSDSYITFASALIPRPAFDQLNGLYEGAFMYFEDSDFCLRARALGWTLAIAPDTAILHREGGSSQSPARSRRQDRTITTAGLLFLGRHAPLPAFSYAIFLISRLAKRLLRLDLPAVTAVLQGARDWCRLPKPPN